MKWMALAEATQRKPAPAERAVRVDRLERVIRAGGIETAASPDERAQRDLIETDQELGEDAHCAITLPQSSSIAARSSLFAAPFARGRMLTTTSTGGSSC